MKNIGIIILVAGLLLTVFGGYSFVTREKVVDLGSVEITQNKKHSLPWSPIAGVAMIIIGGGIYLYGKKGN